MSSILTNTSAMTALATLQGTNSMMEQTQNRISTGLRISTAADNSAYWSISATMKSDNSALSTVRDALGLGAATIDVAYTAMSTTVDLIGEIRNKVAAATQPGLDLGKLQADIDELQNQLQSVVDSAAFSGENLLAANTDATAGNADDTKQIVSSFTRDGAGKVSVGTIDLKVDDIKLTEAGANAAKGVLDTEYTAANGAATPVDVTFSVLTLDLEAANVDATAIEKMVSAITQAENAAIEAASNLGSARNRINIQQDFVVALMDAIDRGVGQLVDADMTEESSRLKSLQVQQQLGIQSLSIANSSAQNILALFR